MAYPNNQTFDLTVNPLQKDVPAVPFSGSESTFPPAEAAGRAPGRSVARDLPIISLITPSLNQGHFLEQAIRSVLDQGYPHLDYIIIDGGSTDDSTEIIARFAGQLSHWTSEQDNGQSQALNKGFRVARGEVMAWLNADDYLEPGVLFRVGEFFAANRDKAIVMGDCNLVDVDGGIFGRVVNHERSFDELRRYWVPYAIPTQPAVFFRKTLIEGLGGLDETLDYAMDYDLWLRFAQHHRFFHLDLVVANYRFHAGSKSGAHDWSRFEREWERVYRRFLADDDASRMAEMEREQAMRQREAAEAGKRKAEAARELADLEWRRQEREQRIRGRAATIRGMVPFPLKRLPFTLFRKAAWMYTRLRDKYDAIASGQVVRTVENTRWPVSLPLVSVIIPCFNYGQFVEAAIVSVLNQTFANLEIIVVDGGSTDPDTLATLRSLALPKTVIHFREGRHLVGDNRNYGIAMARGKYICCLDADDMMAATYLEKALFIAETYHFDIVYPAVKGFGQRDFIWFSGRSDFLSCADANAVSSVALFRKSAWESVAGFRDWGVGDDHVHEDWEFWTRLLGSGFRARGMAEPLMLYRSHDHGLSAGCTKPISDQRRIIRKENRELFSRSNVKRVRRLAGVSYSVANPFVNMRRQGSGNRTILITLPFMVVGGQDTIILQIAEHLVRHRITPVFITTGTGHERAGDNSLRYEAVTAEVYQLHRFLGRRTEWQEFIFYLIETRHIDLIFQVGSEFVYSLMPLLKTSFPGLRIVDQLYNTVGHLASNRARKAYIDTHIVENRDVRRCLIEEYGENPGKVALIANGVDLENFRGDEDGDKTMLTELAIPVTTFVVTFLGRFAEEKAPAFFVDIARRLRNTEDICFVMGGDGPLFPEVRHLVARYGLEEQVLLPGFVDAKRLLAISGVVVVPSRIDGRPNVILESLAMGVPVVASRVGGIPDLVRDGVTGFLCDYGDAAGFADRIRLLAEDRSMAVRMGADGRQHAEEHFDISETRRKYVELFATIMAAGPAGHDREGSG
jgi:glycosyltransferase involved in cell wall biosynthesis